jgi:hypothetical protein
MGFLTPRSPVESFVALIRTGLESGPKRVVGAATVRRLAAYYSVVLALVILVDRIVPLGPTGKVRMLAPWLERLAFGMVTGPHIVPDWAETILAMAAAFILTVPTVTVYVRTRTKEDYDESLMNTVLVLPSVVTAIVIVVQSSLALAFSLTGIVAAVRFRTNLKDSRDALYILAGVAIGFATGVHEPEVAAVASLLFVLLELFAWRSGLGGDQSRTQARLWGDSPVKLAPTVGESQPRDIVFRIEATERERGRRVVEEILAATTKKWRFRRTPQNGGGIVNLQYHARLRRAYSPDQVRDELLRKGAPLIRVAEWVSPTAHDGEPRVTRTGGSA